MRSIPKSKILFFGLVLILANVPLLAEEFLKQKLSPEDIKWEKINIETVSPKNNISEWENLSKDDERKIQQRISTPEVKQSLSLYSQNRSIAFSDGSIGPDIGWKLPNGFMWNDSYSFDLSARGFSGQKRNGSPFLQWNNGDATAQAHWKTFSTKNSSFGINGSMRSVYKGEDHAGGTTGLFEEGLSLGFRYDKKLNNQSGFTIGAEQLIQLDDQTDTGRNIYLMKSKGIWLNNKENDFPLLVINGGIGSGRFASYDKIRLFCFEEFDKERKNTFKIDNDLCFGPVGSISLLPNKSFSIFTEYNSDQLVLAASKELSIIRPTRLTFGVNFFEQAAANTIKDKDDLNWVFRLSTAF